MVKPLILLTGGTGNVGSRLIPELLKRNFDLALLVFAKTQTEAVQRVNDLGSFKDVRIYASDLTRPMMGLSSADFNTLSQSVNGIIHAAASTRFNLPLEQARRYNVNTTENILSFAKKCTRLSCFCHLSTAFVAGKRNGRIYEEEFEHSEGFLNTYEQSKYETEGIIRKEQDVLPIIILRPSLILPRTSKKGGGPINAVSFGLFLAKRGLLPILPGDKKTKIDLIRMNNAVGIITDLFQLSVSDTSLLGKTYHITSGDNAIIMDDIVGVVEKRISRKLSIEFCGDIENFNKRLKEITRLRPDIWATYKKTETFLSELAYPKIFDSKNTISVLNRTAASDKILDDLQELLN